MKNLRSMCFAVVMLGPVSAGLAWAGGGHHGGGGHHHGWGGYYGGFYSGYGFGAYGLGLGLGYGLGYYGGYGPGYYGGYGGYGFGAPYYSPYYSYPPVVTVPSAPSVYIQQQQPQGAVQAPPQAPTNYWYYCRNPEGYYPYIKKCPDGWLQVVPQLQPNN